MPADRPSHKVSRASNAVFFSCVVLSIIFLGLCFSVAAYLSFRACNENTRIEQMLSTLSMPSTYPSRSFPAIFYTFCAKQNKLTKEEHTIRTMTVPVGQDTFEAGELMDDFMNITYSDTFFGQAFGLDNPSESLQYERFRHKAIISSEGPNYWFYEVLDENRGEAAYLKLNKWDGPVRVSVHWPFRAKIDSGSKYAYMEAPVEGIIKDQVQKVIPSLAAGTGLDLSYIDPNEETEDDFAQIRIVYRPYMCGGHGRHTLNWFKLQRCTPDITGGWHGGGDRADAYSGFSLTLWGLNQEYRQSIIPFTPLQRAQVEGVLFADGERINRAVCIIWAGQPEQLMRALVTECLLRALGLPGVSANGDAVLGRWNKALEPYSYYIPLDETGNQHAAFAENLAMLIWDQKYMPYDLTEEEERAAISEFFNSVTVSENLRMEPTSYDLFMLKLLYDPAMSPGMDRETAYRVLLKLFDNREW